jgi:hypothetical protein
MPEYIEINKAKQLLVDGKDAVWFLSEFLDELGITDIQLQNYGGNDELGGFLKQFCKASGFWEMVESLGIVRDAETDPKSAFQSVGSALLAAGLSVPSRPIEITDSQPRTSVFIMPDSESNGMLETILLRSVEDDPAMYCVGEYLKCIENQLQVVPRQMEKARLQVFLASRERVPRMLGIAASQNVWPWDSPVFENIKDFLNNL